MEIGGTVDQQKKAVGGADGAGKMGDDGSVRSLYESFRALGLGE